MVATMPTPAALAMYAAVVFEPDDTVEVRRLPSGRSTWHRAAELAEQSASLQADNAGGEHISIGPNPRTATGGRKAKDVATCRCLFADFDHVDVDDVRFRCESASLPTPTLTLNSGHGVHVYWRLTEPVPPSTWTGWQRDLIAVLDSDPAIHDAPRVMRLPGFTNHKPPVAKCFIIEGDPTRVYELAELHEHIPHLEAESEPVSTPRNNDIPRGLDVVARAAAYLNKTPGAVEGYHGDDQTFRVACNLVNDFGLSVDQAWPLFLEWNQTCDPRWREADLRGKLENAVKYASQPVGAKADTPSPVGRNGRGENTPGKLPEANDDSAAVTICAADVTPESVSWLWQDRFAVGKLGLLVGDPGLGKSFTTIDIASRVSSGTPWTDRLDKPNPPGDVVILSAEDGIADTLVPRLIAANADRSRVFILEGVRRPQSDELDVFRLQQDVRHLEAEIQKHDTRLVVIDPLSGFFGCDRDSYRDTEVRSIIAPLAAMAERSSVAVVCVAHLNKQTSNPKAIYRVLGSMGFVAAARTAWLVCKDPGDESGKNRLFVQVKNNLARDPGGLRFNIGGVGYVEWHDGVVDMSADDALDEPRKRKDTKA
ncbi:MAG: AAA family ATPase, partial [Phycisphaerae bacterium]